MTDKLSILVVTPWYPHRSGPFDGIFVKEQAKALSTFADVRVMHFRPARDSAETSESSRQSHDEELTGPEVHERTFESGRIPMAGTFKGARDIVRLVKKLRSEGFETDVLHAHVYLVVPAVALAAKWLRLPFVVTEHSSAFPREKLSERQLMLVRVAFRMASVTMPVSAFLQSAMEMCGIKTRYEVVPNCVDTSVFFCGHGDSSSPKKALFVGRLVRAKGLDVLLDAFERLNAAGPRAVLSVNGSGSEAADYRSRVESSTVLRETVTFDGVSPHESLGGKMRSSDVLCLPSFGENLPVSVLEALCCGLPVVATEVGGIPEIVSERDGILVPPGDVDALVEALNQMISGGHSYDREQISARAQAAYSMPAVSERLLGIYRYACRIDTHKAQAEGDRELRP